MSRSAVAVALLALACGGRSGEPSIAVSEGPAGASSSDGGQTNGEGGASGASLPESWPGASEVEAVTTAGLPLGNVSGVTYEPAEQALWLVANIPGELFRLAPREDAFALDTQQGWAEGRLLRFPDGRGLADAESVTLGASASDGLYVASEHDNAAPELSRLSVLQYDPAVTGGSLTALREWNVTSALPAVAPNLGIEALTFAPDELLVRGALYDENLRKAYDPADYPDHGGGLFFVGVESTGVVHGFSLDHRGGTWAKVLEVPAPFAGVMSLEYDRETGLLWFGCDNACGNLLGVLRLEQGHFELAHQFLRPPGLVDSNHEGIALGAEAECRAGLKPIYWVDDDALDGVTLRRGRVPCGERW